MKDQHIAHGATAIRTEIQPNVIAHRLGCAQASLGAYMRGDHTHLCQHGDLLYVAVARFQRIDPTTARWVPINRVGP